MSDDMSDEELEEFFAGVDIEILGNRLLPLLTHGHIALELDPPLHTDDYVGPENSNSVNEQGNENSPVEIRPEHVTVDPYSNAANKRRKGVAKISDEGRRSRAHDSNLEIAQNRPMETVPDEYVAVNPSESSKSAEKRGKGVPRSAEVKERDAKRSKMNRDKAKEEMANLKIKCQTLEDKVQSQKNDYEDLHRKYDELEKATSDALSQYAAPQNQLEEKYKQLLEEHENLKRDYHTKNVNNDLAQGIDDETNVLKGNEDCEIISQRQNFRGMRSKSSKQLHDANDLARRVVNSCTNLDVDDDDALEQIFKKHFFNLVKKKPIYLEIFGRFKDQVNAQAKVACEQVIPSLNLGT